MAPGTFTAKPAASRMSRSVPMVIFVNELACDLRDVHAAELLSPAGDGSSAARSVTSLQARTARCGGSTNLHYVPACTWMYFVMCRNVLLILWCPRRSAGPPWPHLLWLVSQKLTPRSSPAPSRRRTYEPAPGHRRNHKIKCFCADDLAKQNCLLRQSFGAATNSAPQPIRRS